MLWVTKLVLGMISFEAETRPKPETSRDFLSKSIQYKPQTLYKFYNSQH